MPNWFETVKEYTQRLVAISSVSPGKGEIEATKEVLNLLCADGLQDRYTAYGLDAVEGDPYGRQNAYAFVRGRSNKTLVLMGHIDTVETVDFGDLESLALDPPRLEKHLDELLGSARAAEDWSDWMFGRGVVDMKSGVAINIALMRHFCTYEGDFPLSIVMLATCDEEYENVGVLQAVQFLNRLREQYDLDYLGVINTDYVTSLYPGDPHRYIYAGTIGKLLPCFYCVGESSHVGHPFDGLDANLLAAELIRDLSMNETLCDAVPGQIVAPPVTLRFTDTKVHYNVQLPFSAYFYLNILTLTTGPGELLERLRGIAQNSLANLLQRIDATEQRWRRVAGASYGKANDAPRTGSVLTYEELYAAAAQAIGEQRLRSELAAEWKRLPDTLDKRECSFLLVQRLWNLSGKQGPAVVIYYAPPYCPHVAPAPGVLYDAVSATVEAHPETNLAIRSYFPYLADISYLCLDPGLEVSALQANMPNWQPNDEAPRPGAYSLPFEAMRQLGLPVINWGPYGHGAHQRDERLLMSYSLGTLPQLIYETIERLA